VLRPSLLTMLGPALAAAVLLLLGPVAAAGPAPGPAPVPWEACGPHSLEEKTVRVFPRRPDAAGPAGDTSELQCGNRYYGLRRIEAQWPVLDKAGRAAVDAAIARTLVSGAVPVLDRRSGNHTYRSPDADVVVGPHGLIIAARPGTTPLR